MNRSTIVIRNSFFFYISFFTAGTQTIITQMYLLKHYPAEKAILLPAILLLGALTGITGAFVSRKYLKVKTSSFTIGLLISLHAFCFLGLLNTGNIILYTLFYIAGCFLMAFLYNYLDNYYARTSDASSINWHIRSLLVFQMLAFIFSPLFFAVSGTALLSTVTVALLAVVTGVPALLILARSNRTGNEAAETKTIQQKQAPMGGKDKLALVYILLLFTVVSIYLSMVTFIVSDYYQFADYSTKSGIALMITSLAACIGVLKLKPLKEVKANENIPDRHFRPQLQLLITFTALVMGLLLMLKLVNSYIYFLIISIVLGYVYGLFLNSTRQYAVNISNYRNSTLFLTIYNNGQSISFVISNILLACIWLLQKAIQRSIIHCSL
jgi:hypothetical protein